jgi:hypothetical protein
MLCPYSENDDRDNDDKDDDTVVINEIFKLILRPSSSILNHSEAHQRKIRNQLLLSELCRSFAVV